MIKNEKAITLIALIITIIVLLILAGVTITSIAGNNGIISQAINAKNRTKASSLEEKVKFWKLNNSSSGYTGTQKESLEDFVNRLFSEGDITEAEKKQILNDNKITIGTGENAETIYIGNTIGDIYTDEMIGKTVRYIPDEYNRFMVRGIFSIIEWIIIGKDDSGNVLITTKEAMGPYHMVVPPLDSTVYACNLNTWINVESILDNAAADYGKTVQGKVLKARSIRTEDIETLLGYSFPKTTYKFGTENDYVNNKVDFYYPDIETGTFLKATTDSYTVGSGSSDIPSVNLEANDYEIKHGYTDHLMSKPENLKYVFGENDEYEYEVAGKWLEVAPGGALAGLPRVENGSFFNDGGSVNTFSINARTFSENTSSTYSLTWIRPVVELPSDLVVKVDLEGVINIVDMTMTE